MQLRLLFAVLLIAATSWGQTPTGISQDSHYSQIYQNDRVQVYSVVLAPQQQSFVRYEHNFLLVSLQDSNLAVWTEGHSDIASFPLSKGGATFFFAGRAQGLRNPANTTYTGTQYRGVLVEFLDPNVTTYGYQLDGQWEYGYSSVAPPTNPQADPFNTLPLGAASVKDYQLPSGASFTAPGNSAGLLVAITDVDFLPGDNSQVHKAPGEVVWIPAGSKSRINAGSQPARFVFIEFSRGSGGSSSQKY